jgi:hypothetical protein
MFDFYSLIRSDEGGKALGILEEIGIFAFCKDGFQLCKIKFFNAPGFCGSEMGRRVAAPRRIILLSVDRYFEIIEGFGGSV